MATIYNDGVTKRIRDDADIQISRDKVPNQLAEKVVPVLISNPERVTNYVISSAGNGTIATTSSTKKTYITGFSCFAANKTAAQDSTSALSVTPKGQASIQIATLTFSTSALIDVAHAEISHTFAVPLLLEKGTAISSSAVNIAARRNIIYGYEVEE